MNTLIRKGWNFLHQIKGWVINADWNKIGGATIVRLPEYKLSYLLSAFKLPTDEVYRHTPFYTFHSLFFGGTKRLQT